MHTQSDTAQVIIGRGADYVMTVKANMPALHRQLKKLPWAAVPSISAAANTATTPATRSGRCNCFRPHGRPGRRPSFPLTDDVQFKGLLSGAPGS